VGIEKLDDRVNCIEPVPYMPVALNVQFPRQGFLDETENYQELK
jgi:hypothetical protein